MKFLLRFENDYGHTEDIAVVDFEEEEEARDFALNHSVDICKIIDFDYKEEWYYIHADELNPNEELEIIQETQEKVNEWRKTWDWKQYKIEGAKWRVEKHKKQIEENIKKIEDLKQDIERYKEELKNYEIELKELEEN